MVLKSPTLVLFFSFFVFLFICPLFVEITSLIFPFVFFWFFCVLICFSFSCFSLGSISFSFPVSFFVLDEVSLLLVYLTLVVLFLSYFTQKFYGLMFIPFLIFSSLLVSSFIVFSTSSFFVLYIFYEASLVPISFVILKWGPYSDRGYSALIIILFTSFFTFPLSLVILFLFSHSSSLFLFSYSVMMPSLPLFFVFWIIFSFAVKLPVYGLHFWLPMAHVEAPTFGSVVLAGLLLKMGGCGLLRIFPLFSSFSNWAGYYFLSYLLFAVVLSAMVCSLQSDFKRLVAYSSVVHISLVCLLLLLPTPASFNAILILIVFHGLSSPLLFSLVGYFYSIYGSRQILIIRGLLIHSPLISFLVLGAFLLNIPVPPLPSFFSEVFMFISIFPLSFWVSFVVLLSLFLVIIYNLSWFTGVVFSPFSGGVKSCPSFVDFLVVFTYIFLSIFWVLVLYIF